MSPESQRDKEDKERRKLWTHFSSYEKFIENQIFLVDSLSISFLLIFTFA